jgi:hypothetical protein
MREYASWTAGNEQWLAQCIEDAANLSAADAADMTMAAGADGGEFITYTRMAYGAENAIRWSIEVIHEPASNYYRLVRWQS